MTSKARKLRSDSSCVWISTGDLKPWKDNPRKNEAAVAKVARSIKTFGFGAPLLARRKNLEVIAGHTRLAAAVLLELEDVPVRLLDVTEREAHALALADNRLGEEAEWDETKLARILADLREEQGDIAAIGFEGKELDRILASLEIDRLAGVNEDDVPDPPKNPTSKPGEVYELGPHRLVCGDSTDIAVVARAMGGATGDMLFTDPPYGVKYRSHMAEGGTASRFEAIQNDDLTPEKLQAFLAVALEQRRTSADAAWCGRLRVSREPAPRHLPRVRAVVPRRAGSRSRR
jgi:hypothetical protein